MKRVLVLGLCLLVVAPAAADARGARPARILKELNEFRTENGFPAVRRLIPRWNRGCNLHNRYAIRNKGWGTDPHDEVPGQPGYTRLGDAAAHNSLLAAGDTSWVHDNPWWNGPFHTLGVLHPRMLAVGVDETLPYNCMAGFRIAARRPRRNRIYVFPGPGTTGNRFMQNATGEGGGSPQERVGLGGRNVGLNILVWWDGPATNRRTTLSRPIAASLRPEGGNPVGVRISDAVPETAAIVPVSPLRAGTTYRASVTFATAAGVRPRRTFSRRWSFTTIGIPADERLVRFSRLRDGEDPSKLYTIRFDELLFGQQAVLRNDYGDGNVQRIPFEMGSLIHVGLSPNSGRPVEASLAVPRFRIGPNVIGPFTVSRTYRP